MKEKILGLDTGTNSLGWAIVEYDSEAEGDKYTLIDKGVNIFQEGVKIEKGIESSRAAERTEHRRIRIGFWRRKIRKIQLLKILIDNDLCPKLSNEDLKAWRSEKKYPLDDAFMTWQRTDENENKNPYYCRNLCLTQKLDLQNKHDRHILGRALYHLNQRRGFLSNRKEDTKESNGEVKKSMDELTQAMHDAGFEYLGQYFYKLYQEGGKIRGKYTSRLDHYEKELLKICEMQGLDEKLTANLRKTIITQRPLKSQKHSVGKCVFEPDKPRCPISHPLFEQYRMYSFINNIKIQGPKDDGLRFLTKEEKKQIIPLFLRKSKKDFKFKDIADKLSGKGNCGYYKDKNEHAYSFNFFMDTSVSGCPVIAQLSEVFDVKNDVDEWIERACEVYTQAVKKNGQVKNRYEIMNDIWHALFFFEDENKLKEFAIEKLQMDDDHATKFSKIHIPTDYASLSLKAIRKILPYMKQYGMIYSHAVFMANLSSVIPCEMDNEALLPMISLEDANDIVEAFEEYDVKRKAAQTEIRTKEEYVKIYVGNKYNLNDDEKGNLKKLYHPSMIETFPKVLKETPNGYFQLGSPRTNSMRNPMAMHSLFRMRHVINTLLKKGKINADTTIHIEFSRNLNDANKRAAIHKMNKKREEKNTESYNEIRKLLGEDYEPSNTDLMKYRLWEEQKHICLYTGKRINLTELFDPNKFDIEHTIPQSVGGDSTDENLTICDSRYNREVKRAQIPTQLANHEEIMERITHWKEKIDDLNKQLGKTNTKGISDKETKDRNIQKRHLLELERNYWKGKYDRFTMTEVPEGFSRRQGVDISVISKYARLYIKSLFRHVYVVKGIATSDFRKIWGIQDEYTKKQRVNHCHHAIDAITIACIGKAEYDKLAQYYHDEERYEWGLSSKRAVFPKPWKTFTEDIKQVEDTLLISHYTADNMGKRTRKKIRKNGKFTSKYMEGDTARLSLHLDTYYGAIEHNGEICYVVRKPIDQLADKDIDKIVDNVVRQRVEEAITKHGNLKIALQKNDIWMNEEKQIPINKVRIYAHTTQTLNIRNHRDVSHKEYKRSYHVVNDSNYMMGIYIGVNKKGKEDRKYQLINCLDAAKYFNNKGISELLPSNINGYTLKWKLKIGTMVLLYENTPKEIYNASKDELSKRLYKVYGMDKFGRIKLIFHQEARPSKDTKEKNGEFKKGEDLRARIVMFYSYMKALVEDCDFLINDVGEITFLKND